MREYLKILRVNAGLSQQSAAELLGISQNYLSEIENDNRQMNIRLKLLKDFSRVYGVPLGDLISNETREEVHP